MAASSSLKSDKADVEISQLPNSWNDPQDLKDTAIRYRNFRLLALHTAPDAFAATYEQEVEFSEERWLKRLQNKDAIQFLATRSDQDQEPHKRIEWIGMVVLVRKDTARAQTDYNLSQKIGTQEDRQGHEAPNSFAFLVFQVNGLFVDPAYHGIGLGKRLIQRCLDFVRVEAKDKGLSAVKVETLVDSWNSRAIGLYERQGFVRSGNGEYIVGNSKRQAINMEQTISDIVHIPSV